MLIQEVIDFMREQGFDVDEPISKNRTYENTKITEVTCKYGVITDGFDTHIAGYTTYIHISYQDITNLQDFGKYDDDWKYFFKCEQLDINTGDYNSFVEKFIKDITKDDLMFIINKAVKN